MAKIKDSIPDAQLQKLEKMKQDMMRNQSAASAEEGIAVMGAPVPLAADGQDAAKAATTTTSSSFLDNLQKGLDVGFQTAALYNQVTGKGSPAPVGTQQTGGYVQDFNIQSPGMTQEKKFLGMPQIVGIVLLILVLFVIGVFVVKAIRKR